MKKATWILAAIAVILAVVCLNVEIKTELVPERVSDGAVWTPDGIWSEDSAAADEVCFQYLLPVREDGSESEWILMLRTHWTDYEIRSDEKIVYQTDGKRTGAVHLFQIPKGETLTIRFLGTDSSAAKAAVEQSQVILGDKSGFFWKLFRENLYAALFAVLSCLLGVLSIGAGIYMRNAWSGEMCSALRSLGIFILSAGVWIVTDSNLLLLVTQQTGMVELISFLAFFTLPIPLLIFTGRMLPGKERMFRFLELAFLLMLILLTGNEIGQFLSVSIMIIAEHLLMALTIVSIMAESIRELKKRKNTRLFRVTLGYAAFSVCSIAALTNFYWGNSRAYSLWYMAGILEFVLLLGDAACIAVYDQIRKNANVVIYAKMAFEDMMTGLGNRAAFLRDQELDRTFAGRLAYIMVDANNLKKTNDTFGHQKGDELLFQVSGCMKRVAEKAGGWCYRVGGDEFVVRLRNCRKQDAEDLMEEIRSAIGTADQQSDITISAAMGCAWTDSGTKDTEELLKQADAAMYQNKQEMKKEGV